MNYAGVVFLSYFVDLYFIDVFVFFYYRTTDGALILHIITATDLTETKPKNLMAARENRTILSNQPLSILRETAE